jgi:hypothetical protein
MTPHNKARSQVFTGIELSATALDLSDKLMKTPSGIDWFLVADIIKADWYDSVDFELLVKSEPDLMVFLKEQMIFSSRDVV